MLSCDRLAHAGCWCQEVWQSTGQRRIGCGQAVRETTGNRTHTLLFNLAFSPPVGRRGVQAALMVHNQVAPRNGHVRGVLAVFVNGGEQRGGGLAAAAHCSAVQQVGSVVMRSDLCAQSHALRCWWCCTRIGAQ